MNVGTTLLNYSYAKTKDESLGNSQWCLLRTPHNYPMHLASILSGVAFGIYPGMSGIAFSIYPGMSGVAFGI